MRKILFSFEMFCLELSLAFIAGFLFGYVIFGA